MKTIFLTGDTHRNFGRIYKFIENLNISQDEEVIVTILGDGAINFEGEFRDRFVKEKLQKRLPENTVLFMVHGNHENRVTNIKSYKETSFLGATAYVEPAYKKLLFSKDGEIYRYRDKKILVIGGAYSVDKQYRRSFGYPWWPDEQPSEEIKKYTEAQLDMVGWKIDYVFSHTCPRKYLPTDTFSKYIDQSKVDYSTEEWLDEIEDKLDYERWFCGHFHINRTVDKLHFLYENVEFL